MDSTDSARLYLHADLSKSLKAQAKVTGNDNIVDFDDAAIDALADAGDVLIAAELVA